MEVDCEGCAGCCIDWRPLTETPSQHERRGPGEPLDDTYNLVPLTRDDVRALVAAGLGDACVPRFFQVEEGGISVDGYQLATIDGRPAFYLGLRTPPKPVAPFDTDPHWLDTCVFLDPNTLQCRIHGEDHYPTECADYPGHNLKLDAETECERVTAATDRERLLDDEPPADLDAPLRGPGAVGWRVFVVRERGVLDGSVLAALAEDTLSRSDRAVFVATAAASAPGTTVLNERRYESTLEKVRETSSWAGEAVEAWRALAATEPADPSLANAVETERDAPDTPGWT